MSEPVNEGWSDFGRYIENFLLINKEKLIEDNFDLFIGFSRGGAILSNILSCLIKDKFDYYKEKLQKLSLRTIPSGIYVKSDDVCYLINKTATEDELNDIYNKLKNDLDMFHSEHCKGKKLNIIIIDDNLTGSTRIFEAKSFLKTLPNIGIVKTLAYTRVKDFKVPKLDYQIREYPANALFFIMPWHYVHITSSHPILFDTSSKTTLVFILKCKNEINFDQMINAIEKNLPYHHVYKHDDPDFSENKNCVNFRIGTIDLGVYYNKQQNTVDVYYQVYKTYPPKGCLNNKKIFDSKSLCQKGDSITTDLCTLCTILNCNAGFFKMLVSNGKFSKIDVEYLYEDSTSADVLSSVNSWFLKNKSELGF